MSFTYDPSTTIGHIRLLIADTDSTHPIFTDEEVNASIAMEGSYPRMCAAMLLESLAANRARLASVAAVLDIKLSAAEAAKELRELATLFRDSERDSGAFAIAEQAVDIFAARERWWKQYLRTST
jgi:hypothetical protein